MFYISGVYRAGLLSKLLVKHPKYLVEQGSDLANLPDHIQIYSHFGEKQLWVQMADRFPSKVGDKIRSRIRHDTISNYHEAGYMEIAEKVRQGNVVMIKYGGLFWNILKACDRGFRFVECILSSHRKLAVFVSNKSTRPL